MEGERKGCGRLGEGGSESRRRAAFNVERDGTAALGAVALWMCLSNEIPEGCGLRLGKDRGNGRASGRGAPLKDSSDRWEQAARHTARSGPSNAQGQRGESTVDEKGTGGSVRT